MASSSNVITVDVGALETLAQRLKTATFALGDDVGVFADGGNGIEHRGLRETVDRFDERWSDKRRKVVDGLEQTGEAIKTIADSFSAADDELAQCVLDGGGAK